MKLRRVATALATAIGLAASLSAVPAQAQTYGGLNVDCYLSSFTAPTPMQSREPNHMIAKGGNHGNKGGNCRVTGHISRVEGGYERDFRIVNLFVPKGGRFEVQFSDRVGLKGQYKITACARATGPSAAHPADDCKTIFRNSV